MNCQREDVGRRIQAIELVRNGERKNSNVLVWKDRRCKIRKRLMYMNCRKVVKKNQGRGTLKKGRG